MDDNRDDMFWTYNNVVIGKIDAETKDEKVTVEFSYCYDENPGYGFLNIQWTKPGEHYNKDEAHQIGPLTSNQLRALKAFFNSLPL